LKILTSSRFSVPHTISDHARPTNKMNTLLYDRVSTDQQNMQRQDYMLAREVERLGAPVLESFMDPDVSGSMTMRERPRGTALRRLRQTAV